MTSLLDDLSNAFGLGLPEYGMTAAIILLLYAIQAELRFGARARSYRAGARDRGSTLLLSAASIAPILGFVLVMKTQSSGTLFGLSFRLPGWAMWPVPSHNAAVVGWTGVAIAALGLLLRLWAVLTLRDRYTRTLLVNDDHRVERGGPYTIVRHPGYVGSLLCLNGLALASGSVVVGAVSVAATFLAYAYRVRAEDEMLVERFGKEYDDYRRDVAALIPFVF
jgi:protein-S-isoprenylcysteine O-methyltransferase